ncbi:ROK family transcriptional regulator [Nocardioides bigeumensis]|jgi:predicted NBD/HSP70 family sugar kinase|uniref:ROK family transcriptional regulator n=1 Tax=Nocardioides bigeumensis TaxID=433657 RepID=A0ABN2YKA8_9ACTN
MTSPRPDAGAAPGSTASLRTANRHRVLDVLRDEAGVFTQAELARATGLAPATVSSLVRELSEEGLVEAEPGSGRRGSAVRLSRETGIVAGIDFGHSHVAVAVGDLSGRILGEYRRRLQDSVDHHVALADARTMLDSVRVGSARLRAVGLGLPAPIAGDVVQSSAIFPGWEGVNAREVAEEVFQVPAHVDNDANLGALAEHRIGAARGHDSSVYVKTASGVGAGIIVDNELFQGASGTAGEIGHLTIDDNGPLCRCGKRGCLEAYTSTPFVTREVSGQVPGADDIDKVVAAAREGNVAARRALEEAGHHLGRGLAAVVNLINPSIVVVGGHLAMAGDLLLDSARISLRRYAVDPVASTPVLPSALEGRASTIGAVLLAAERTTIVD